MLKIRKQIQQHNVHWNYRKKSSIRFRNSAMEPNFERNWKKLLQRKSNAVKRKTEQEKSSEYHSWTYRMCFTLFYM